MATFDEALVHMKKGGTTCRKYKPIKGSRWHYKIIGDNLYVGQADRNYKRANQIWASDILGEWELL